MTSEREQVLIEVAQPGDLEGITRVFYDCWTITYPKVLPAELIEKFEYPGALALWQRVLGEAAAGELLVARRGGGEVVGVTRWAIVGRGMATPAPDGSPEAPAPDGSPEAPAPDGSPEAAAPEAAVHSLYVSPSAQGLGVGSRLLARACELAARAGAGFVRLWVFEENAPSREFYARHGFTPDGGTRTQEQFGQPELRLVKDLSGVGR